MRTHTSKLIVPKGSETECFCGHDEERHEVVWKETGHRFVAEVHCHDCAAESINQMRAALFQAKEKIERGERRDEYARRMLGMIAEADALVERAKSERGEQGLSAREELRRLYREVRINSSEPDRGEGE